MAAVEIAYICDLQQELEACCGQPAVVHVRAKHAGIPPEKGIGGLKYASAFEAGKQPIEAASRELVLAGKRGNRKALGDDLEAEKLVRTRDLGDLPARHRIGPGE
jgi:hypothetical protein